MQSPTIWSRQHSPSAGKQGRASRTSSFLAPFLISSPATGRWPLRQTLLKQVRKFQRYLLTFTSAPFSAEKTWFLNQCWILGTEMDDDVMDQQKFASAAMVLAKAMVDLEKQMEHRYHPEQGHILPEIPLHKAREIMTRADFIQVSCPHVYVFSPRLTFVPELRCHQHLCN